MKTVQIYTLFLMLFISMGIYAQTTVSGIVTEQETGTPLPGVNVFVEGTTNGTTTDFDGNYEITTENGSTLVFSYIGFQTIEIVVTSENIDVALEEDRQQLDEVVVIGYGTTTRADATGSVTSISSEDFNQGPIVSPAQLIQGKVAGVAISSGDGAPGSGNLIRIRGLSSLSGNSDPLFVIDGVPLDRDGIDGARNPLNLINPNDVESISILKDASATAIYGARASAGVIIITTKKGTQEGFNFNYDVNTQISEVREFIDALSADDFREVITQYDADNGTTRVNLLGNNNTNWQDEIYRTGVGINHSLSTRGNVLGVPIRASLGYTDIEGVLLTSNLERFTGSLSLSPTFFDEHLTVNLNAKGAYIENRFADTGQVSAAVAMDPTKPVRSDDPQFDTWGGYWQWLNSSGTGLLANTTRNPVASLLLRENTSIVRRFVGNAQFDYKFHFLPDLRANLNLGLEYTNSKGQDVSSPQLSTDGNLPGFSSYELFKQNRLLDFYFQYEKYFEDSFLTKFDLQAGYSYQNFKDDPRNVFFNNNTGMIENQSYIKNVSNLQSFFGRANINLFDKYLFTLTLRRDGSSRWLKENRWGNFPSASFAWKIHEEGFLKDVEALDQLKLRLGWGVTGNQELSDNFYPSIPVYSMSNNQAQYIFGDGSFNTIRPNPYNPALKWEETTTYNAGLDFSFLRNRMNGSVDVYQREVKDLLNRTFFPAGTNTTNVFDANIADMVTKGIEVNLNLGVISTEDINLEFGFNFTAQDIEVTKLIDSDDPNFVDDTFGGITGAIGNNVQALKAGQIPYSYYVYEQVYDTNGYPLHGVFVDRNGDGRITLDDRYIYKSPFADILIGFNPKFSYKDFDFTMNWRASIGNYAYNNIDSNLGQLNALLGVNGSLQNGVENYLVTEFPNQSDDTYLSNYYVQDASFVKLDNISVGYSLGDVICEDTNLRLYGSVQNVLILTNYDGIDPEVGIDYNFYPRPRTLVLGLNIEF